jgi:hypothetical protein
MASVKPPLYVSRVLPDPVMAAIRERFELVREPLDDSSAPSALQSGLSESVAAIVTLTDRLDADVLAAAPRLKIVANYAVGYNNIDVDAARQRGIVVTNTPDVLTDATADLTWALILAAGLLAGCGDDTKSVIVSEASQKPPNDGAPLLPNCWRCVRTKHEAPPCPVKACLHVRLGHLQHAGRIAH